MNVELVRVATEDKIQLDGALHPGTKDQPLVICLHGVGGNFYGGTLFSELLPPLQARNHAVLWANTRGHDSITFSGSPGPALGAAFEIVDHCRLDFAAWAEWAETQGFSKLILLGHSLGAIKAVYSQSVQPLDGIHSIIAASPPKLSYLAFRNGPRSSAFFEDMQIANQLIEEGKGDQLFLSQIPFPLYISAATYIDKYGPGERYNILNALDQLNPPALFTYGSLELESGNVAFAGLDDAVRDKTKDRPITVNTIDGANHSYSGKRSELGKVIGDWLDAL